MCQNVNNRCYVKVITMIANDNKDSSGYLYEIMGASVFSFLVALCIFQNFLNEHVLLLINRKTKQ